MSSFICIRTADLTISLIIVTVAGVSTATAVWFAVVYVVFAQTKQKQKKKKKIEAVTSISQIRCDCLHHIQEEEKKIRTFFFLAYGHSILLKAINIIS